MKEYEYNKETSQVRAWATLIGFALFIFTFGMSVHHRIPEEEYEWDFGALPDTPGESVYSTVSPPLDPSVPDQVAPLPELMDNPSDKDSTEQEIEP